MELQLTTAANGALDLVPAVMEEHPLNIEVDEGHKLVSACDENGFKAQTEDLDQHGNRELSTTSPALVSGVYGVSYKSFKCGSQLTWIGADRAKRGGIQNFEYMVSHFVFTNGA